MRNKLGLLIGLIGIALGFGTHAQEVLQGKILDAKSKEALPYAFIRPVGAMGGTQSNLDGEYTLHLAEADADLRIAVSCAGYQSDTLGLRALRKHPTIKLKPLTINLQAVHIMEYTKPSALLAEVVRRIPENYYTDTMVGTFFFRNYSLTADSLWRYVEAMAEVMRVGYDKQFPVKNGRVVFDLNGKRDSLLLAGNHKRYTASRMPVYDTSILVEMLGDSNYLLNPFVGRRQTIYNDISIFHDLLQNTKGNTLLDDKANRQLNRQSTLATYDDEQGNSFYLITYKGHNDSTSILINRSDKALLHYYHTILHADTLNMPWPLNKVLRSIYITRNRVRYDYAKVGDRYTLVLSMNEISYGVMPPKRSMLGGKVNRVARELITDHELSNYTLWVLTDLQPADYRFMRNALQPSKYDYIFYPTIFDHESRMPDSYWEKYHTVPVEGRIAKKLQAAQSKH